MLNSLLIKNYRLFKELQIDSLKRVNLIIGKNNVGKSSLLEAVFAYLDKKRFAYHLTANTRTRGEILDYRLLVQGYYTGDSHIREIVLNGLNGLTSLFYGRTLKSDQQNSGYIGVDENEGVTFSLLLKLEKGDFCFIIEDGNEKLELPISKFEREVLFSHQSKINNFQFVSPASLYEESSLLASFWSKTVLTDKENDVIDALKIIEKKISRIAFAGESVNDQKILIKLDDTDHPVAIGSFGEGILHLFTIILKLVHCKNGAMLIDEFETGLHWSVQAELWKIIFSLSRRLNIQIFATTHSRDTLWALQQVAIAEGLEEETRIIKLKSLPKKQTIKAVELEVDQIKELLEQGLEIR